jgi:hypothetical protein
MEQLDYSKHARSLGYPNGKLKAKESRAIFHDYLYEKKF